MVELMNPGGGGSSTLEVSDGTTNVNAVTEIIFSGATVNNGGGGIADVSINGVSFETPSGTVDNSNMTFTVAHTPVYIVVNGLLYTVGVGIFTSYSAPTITLSTPVGTGGFILSAHT